MIKKTSLVKYWLALLPSLAFAQAPTQQGGFSPNVGGFTPASNVYQGDGTNTRLLYTYQGGAGNYSEPTRSIHKSVGSFSSLEVLLGGYIVPQSNVDTLFTDSYNVQVAFEFPVYQGYSSIPTNTRLQFTCSLSTTCQIIGGTTIDKMTDPLNIQSLLPPPYIQVPQGAPYALWTTYQDTNGASTTSGKLPVSIALGSYQNGLYEGNGSFTTDNISSNWVMTATSITASSAPGVSNGVTPIAILPLESSFIISALGDGDCIWFGNDDGGPANVSKDTDGNEGFGDKYLYKLGIAQVNFARGTNSFSIMATTANMQYKMHSAAQLHVDDVVEDNGHNDQTHTYSVISANEASTIANWKTVLPNAKYIGVTLLPSGTFTGSFMTQTNQTPFPSWTSGGAVYQYNTTLRSTPATLGYNAMLDAESTVSYGGPGTGLWQAPTSTTTLAAAITTTTQTTAQFAGPLYQQCPDNPNDTVWIDNEAIGAMNVASGASTLTIVRSIWGTGGSNTTTHASGATVTLASAMTPDYIHPTTCGVLGILNGFKILGNPNPF